MLTKIEKQQVAILCNFLVPLDGPDRLVKNWNNVAETENGNKIEYTAPAAVRFCILGGWIYLYPDSQKCITHELDMVTPGGHWNTAVTRTPDEVRKVLNKIIEN